ncbi:MAG: pirin family protein [Acidobacteria bacterium]|nr:pirin family protein [Acidobacteriota bacterium]
MAIHLEGKIKDLDGLRVSRILPQRAARMVGPFIFLDHMGPAEFLPGEGIDVLPHPHIGLSTLTYLFEGSLLHRDSLGNHVEILPGEVNWMTAGCGIVHSERETIEIRAKHHRIQGLQCWVALPEQEAETQPSFTHLKREQLPQTVKDGVIMRLVAGAAYDMTSPINTHPPFFFVDVMAKGMRTVFRPQPHQACMIYLLRGAIRLGHQTFQGKHALLLESETHIATLAHSRMILLGGEVWPKTPLMDWNFVSFSRERLDQARKDWQSNRFPVIQGDSEERASLPE